MLVQKYKLLHVSTGDLLRARRRFMPELADYMDKGLLVPDTLICQVWRTLASAQWRGRQLWRTQRRFGLMARQVLQERLQEPDATGRGVLLDGFPRTRKQAQLLSDVGIRVRFVIHLDVPDEIVTERVDGRRIDPVSGRVYHVTFRPPTDEKITARLIQRSDDTMEKMKVRRCPPAVCNHTQLFMPRCLG
jgi:adenylate kinase